ELRFVYHCRITLLILKSIGCAKSVAHPFDYLFHCFLNLLTYSSIQTTDSSFQSHLWGDNVACIATANLSNRQYSGSKWVYLTTNHLLQSTDHLCRHGNRVD